MTYSDIITLSIEIMLWSFGINMIIWLMAYGMGSIAYVFRHVK